MSETKTPDTSWDVEVALRVRGGEDEETVRAEVYQRYLDAADPRPLVSDILDKRRPISALIWRRVEAMLERNPTTNEPVPTVFDIRLRERSLTPEAQRRLKWFQAGKAALVEDRDPDWFFWFVFARSLCVGHPTIRRGELPDTPLKVRIRFRERRHRPKDPTLEIRNCALRWSVEEALKAAREARKRPSRTWRKKMSRAS